MKKVKFEKKLSLKKEVVTNLNDFQLKSILGGNLPASYIIDSWLSCCSHGG